MIKKFLHALTYFTTLFVLTFSVASEELNTKEILDIIQKDLRTLERAVYSDSFQKKSSSSNSLSDKETEDALTRHLLKLSEIEKQLIIERYYNNKKVKQLALEYGVSRNTLRAWFKKALEKLKKNN